ncbi:MAG: hypothetical protein JNJ54_21500 [Myxococcaceae bacterium]|nr:hypothetical protein [Myxococcaceae bacterium]
MPRVTRRPAPVAGAATAPKRPSTTATTSPEARTAAAAWSGRGPRGAKLPLLGPPASFQTPQTTLIGPAKLASRAIASVNVKQANELQFQGLTGANPLMTKTLDVQFGRLSQPQFEALKTEFGGASQVKFDPNREYVAIDFLPPSLQALVNRDIDAGPAKSIKGTSRLNDAMGNEGRGDLEIHSAPNCHGTAWEMMRAYQGQPSAHVSLLYGDAQLVGPHYEDPAMFTTVGAAESGKTPAFLKDLKPGDVLAFKRGDSELLHSAVYVGGGLFFEKPNTESDAYEESPYRLVTLEQALAPITDYAGEPPSIVGLRPKGVLPPGIEAFSTGDDAQKLEAWAAKKGQTIGKPLVREFEVGMGGGIRGLHFNAVETARVDIGADGRGVIR